MSKHAVTVYQCDQVLDVVDLNYTIAMFKHIYYMYVKHNIVVLTSIFINPLTVKMLVVNYELKSIYIIFYINLKVKSSQACISY